MLLPACGREDPAPRLPGGVRIETGTVPGRLVLELWQARPGVPLATWAASNLNDFAVPPDTAPWIEHWGDVCAQAVRRFDVGPRPVARIAFFYPPAPPRDLALPDSMSPETVRSCVLGALALRAPADSAVGVTEADSLRAILSRVYGAPQQGPPRFFGAALWQRSSSFRADSVTVLSGFDARAGSLSGTESTAVATAVFAYALLPASGLTSGPGGARDVRSVVVDSFPLDSAAALAALDTALWSRLRRVLGGRAAWAEGAAAAAPAESLVRPLVRWLDASAALGPARRAAALYVADAVLDRAACAHALCERGDSAAQAPLRARGARFTWSPLGGSWVYERTWMGLARALERDSPLGQRILLEQLGRDFDFSGICRDASGGQRTLENGLRYLERVADSPIRAEVHFLVAEAYRDVVALAAGAGDVYADASAYTAEAPAARDEALRHYRAAIAVAPGSAVARSAWQRAWWLLSGLRPRGLTYFCVYD